MLIVSLVPLVTPIEAFEVPSPKHLRLSMPNLPRWRLVSLGTFTFVCDFGLPSKRGWIVLCREEEEDGMPPLSLTGETMATSTWLRHGGMSS